MIRPGRAPIPPVLDKRGRVTPRRPARSDVRAILRQCPACLHWHEFGVTSGVVEVRCCCTVDKDGRGVLVWVADLRRKYTPLPPPPALSVVVPFTVWNDRKGRVS